MALNTELSWLPVTTMADGTELRLPLHVVKGARPGPTLGLTALIMGGFALVVEHNSEVLPEPRAWAALIYLAVFGSARQALRAAIEGGPATPADVVAAVDRVVDGNHAYLLRLAPDALRRLLARAVSEPA